MSAAHHETNPPVATHPLEVVSPVPTALALPGPADRPAARVPDTESLYRDHFDFVWSNLRRFGVEPPDLEDAAHDVFVVAHRRAAGFRGSSAVRTWLFGIVRRVAKDHRRSRFRHRRRIEALGRTLGVLAGNRDHRRLQAGAEVQEFLDTLDEDKRSVFILAELEQMTGKEIGEALGINPNTASARLRAARKAFEAQIQRLDGDASCGAVLDRARRDRRVPSHARLAVWALVTASLGMAPATASAASGLSGAGNLASIHGWTLVGALAASIAIGMVASAPLEPPTSAMHPSLHPAQALTDSADDALPASLALHLPAIPVHEDTAHTDAVATPATEPDSTSHEHSKRRGAAKSPDLGRQNAMLKRARTAHRSGDTHEVLAIAAEYRRTFSRGLFDHEFSILRLRSLCRLGENAAFVREVARLRRRHPSSPYRDQTDRLCEEARR